MVYIKDLRIHDQQEVTLKGWVSNKRSGKGIVFIILRDGSGFCQCIAGLENIGEEQFKIAESLGLESSLALSGKVVKDERQVGGYELQVSKIEVYHLTDQYPIAKKEHGVDFLMDKRHLWLRSKKQWAIMKVRNQVIFAIHKFFQERGFVQMDAPIFTGNACEGTTDLFATDYFGMPAYLSQSGQLYGEAMAMAQGLIYTFGPTFRAEKSKTRRHLTEFWMIEPEMAFYDLEMDMDLIEDFVRYVVSDVVEKCKIYLEVLGRDVEFLGEVNSKFPRITYKEAVEILRGEKEVNGKFSHQILEEDLRNLQAQIEKNATEIEERQATIDAGGIKKPA